MTYATAVRNLDRLLRAADRAASAYDNGPSDDRAAALRIANARADAARLIVVNFNLARSGAA